MPYEHTYTCSWPPFLPPQHFRRFQHAARHLEAAQPALSTSFPFHCPFRGDYPRNVETAERARSSIRYTMTILPVQNFFGRFVRSQYRYWVSSIGRIYEI